MPIDNPDLLNFCDQSIRSGGDLLAGVIPFPTAVLDTVKGKGIAALLGTTDGALFRAETWTKDDYAKLGEPQEIVGTGSSGRTVLTNFDVIAILRVLVVLRYMIDTNPQLGPLVRKIAVNPRG